MVQQIPKSPSLQFSLAKTDKRPTPPIISVICYFEAPSRVLSLSSTFNSYKMCVKNDQSECLEIWAILKSISSLPRAPKSEVETLQAKSEKSSVQLRKSSFGALLRSNQDESVLDMYTERYLKNTWLNLWLERSWTMWLQSYQQELSNFPLKQLMNVPSWQIITWNKKKHALLAQCLHLFLPPTC